MTVREAVLEHVAAFNAHDRERILAGLAADVTWSTGRDTRHGQAALTELFDDGLWELAPHLHVVRLLVEGDRAAAEIVETLTIDGAQHVFAIACFFDLQHAVIHRVTVFREGTADLP